MNSPLRKLVHYEGEVQGVGFRYTTQRIAQSFPVTGYVRNLTDGRVELVAEGNAAEVNAFLQQVAQAMAHGIEHISVQEGPATHEFDAFQVRR